MPVIEASCPILRPLRCRRMRRCGRPWGFTAFSFEACCFIATSPLRLLDYLAQRHCWNWCRAKRSVQNRMRFSCFLLKNTRLNIGCQEDNNPEFQVDEDVDMLTN